MREFPALSAGFSRRLPCANFAQIAASRSGSSGPFSGPSGPDWFNPAFSHKAVYGMRPCRGVGGRPQARRGRGKEVTENNVTSNPRGNRAQYRASRLGMAAPSSTLTCRSGRCSRRRRRAAAVDVPVGAAFTSCISPFFLYKKSPCPVELPVGRVLTSPELLSTPSLY